MASWHNLMVTRLTTEKGLNSVAHQEAKKESQNWMIKKVVHLIQQQILDNMGSFFSFSILQHIFGFLPQPPIRSTNHRKVQLNFKAASPIESFPDFIVELGHRLQDLGQCV